MLILLLLGSLIALVFWLDLPPEVTVTTVTILVLLILAKIITCLKTIDNYIDRDFGDD